MDTLNQTDAETHNILEANIDKLKAIFPEVFSEGKVDFDRLKGTLGSYCETSEERYNFTWPGKSRARRLAQAPTTGTLRPCPEESVDWDTTQNLFIEGDNLEVLKLLQKSYQGQVKMIYIDPPYNTGGDFVYPDKYADNLKGYLEFTKQVDGEGNKVSSNTESTGRKHSNWLNMLYPRLQLAKNLLSKEGIIFISIDDNEVKNLRSICDEIFGEESFLAQIVWQKIHSTKNDAKYYSDSHEYLLCYAKVVETAQILLLPRTEEMDSRFKNPDDDPRGPWSSGDLVANEERTSGYFDVISPGGKTYNVPKGKHWVYSQENLERMIAEGRIWFGKNGDAFPRLKRYLSEVQQGRKADTLWLSKEVGHNQEAKRELKKLFNDKVYFDTPKPVRLLRRCIDLTTEKDDIILDFFAGSCATAQAALVANIDDNKNLKSIMVQLPEAYPKDSEAYHEGYKTIADLGKERIRRAAAKIKETHPDYDGDLGFKVFKLDSSNIEAWDSNAENLEENVLKAANMLKDDRSELDIVYELFLKYGLDLSYPVNTHTVAGKQVYEIGAGSLFICLEDGITTDFVEALITLYQGFDSEEAPRVVFKDSGFATDAAKKDAESTLKNAGILDVKCL